MKFCLVLFAIIFAASALPVHNQQCPVPVTEFFQQSSACVVPEDGSKICFNLRQLFNDVNYVDNANDVDLEIWECLGDWKDCYIIVEPTKELVHWEQNTQNVCILREACKTQHPWKKCARHYYVGLLTEPCGEEPWASIVVPANPRSLDGKYDKCGYRSKPVDKPLPPGVPEI